MRAAEHLRQRYTAILKYAGLIWAITGLLLLLPLVALPFFWEERSLAWGFVLPGVTLALVGLALWRGLHPPEGLSLTIIEGTVIVVLVWLAAITVGSLPFVLVGGLDFSLAYFESTSGWTTTGLSVVDVTAAPRLILLYRSLMQLAGGAGFAIIVLATLTGPTGIGLSSAEGREELLAPHVRQSAGIVLTIYMGYVLFGIVGLRLVGMSWFDAINHSFSALSTGGFSTRVESIGYWNSPAIEAFTIVLMLMGTTSFLTSYALLRGEFRSALRNTEWQFLAFLLLLFTPIVFATVALQLYSSISAALRVAVFEVVAAASTTGFSTVGYGDWPNLGWLVLLVLMLIGGGAGSTAGGIKQLRVVVLLRGMMWEIRRWFLPRRAVTAPHIWQVGERRFLSDDRVRRDAAFITLYLLVFLVGSGILVAHGYSLVESFFEFASTVGTVGLSIGVTSAEAPTTLLWTQVLGMILGRLEFFAVIVGVAKVAGDLPTMLRRPEEEAAVVIRRGRLSPGRFLVLVPVATRGYTEALSRVGALLAKGAQGQLMGLTVIQVPPLLSLLAARFMLRDQEALIEKVMEQGRECGIPVQGLVRSTRDVAQGIQRTIRESGSNLVIFGWPEKPDNVGQAFSPVVDSLLANPPSDTAVLRYRPFDELRTLVVPVAGRANERLAVQLAVNLARSNREPATIQLMYAALPDLSEAENEERAEAAFARVVTDISVPYETRVVKAGSVAEGILQAAQACDMVIIGATKEPVFRNLLLGNVAQTVAEQAPCSVLVVKRRSNLVRSLMRETILRPVPRSSKSD